MYFYKSHFKFIDHIKIHSVPNSEVIIYVNALQALDIIITQKACFAVV